MLRPSYDSPFKKQNPQSVHTQGGSYKESLENSRGNPNPTPRCCPQTPSQQLRKGTAKLALLQPGRRQFSVLPWPLLPLQHSNWTNPFSVRLCEAQGALPSPKPLLRVLSSLWKEHLLCKHTAMPNNPSSFPGALVPAGIKIRRVSEATGCGPSWKRRRVWPA